MMGGWWNACLLIVVLVGGLIRNCQASQTSCSLPSITRLNFYNFVSILNGTNRTLSCEVHSDTPLKGDPIWRRDYPPTLPAKYSVDNSSCSLSTNKTCVLSNLTLILVTQGHYEGNYSLTAENDCGNASVYVYINIKIPAKCESDYNKPLELLTPPPPVVQVVQGESVTIKAVYKGNINDPNLLAYWCVTTRDGSHCIFSTDNDTIYDVMTIYSCPPTNVDCCYFNVSIEIKSLTLNLSQASLTSVAVWKQNPESFNPGNSTLVVNVHPTLDKWLPYPNSIEIDEGHSTEFICIYNASTNPNITMTTWKFKEDYLRHNTSHYTMTTEYGTDPANGNRILSKLKISNVTPDNAGIYTCQCVYNSDNIYGKGEFYSRTETFHLEVKPGDKQQSYTLYVIIGVALVATVVLLSVIFLMYWIWRRQKNKNETVLQSSDQSNQNNNQANQNNSKSDDQNPNETMPLLKDQQVTPMDDFAAAATSDGYGAFRRRHIPEERISERRDIDTTTITTTTTTSTTTATAITTVSTTTGTVTVTIANGTAITATVTVNNQPLTPCGNGQPDSDASSGRDKDAKKLPTKPLLHDPLPTDHPIASEPEGQTSSDSNFVTELCANKPSIELLNDHIEELAAKRYQIGKCLLKEVWTHKLNTIEKNNPESAEGCYDELLAYWLNSCEANWSKMIGALEKINQDALVQMIKSDDSIRGTDKPTHQLLLKYVRNPAAPYWRDLGEMLLEEESVDMLNIIEKNHPNDVQTCCREMLAHWLRTDTKASWNKLIVVLEQMDLKTFAANITEHVLKVHKPERPQKSKTTKHTHGNKSGCERVLLQASGMPDTQISTNNNANQYVTPEPSTRHEDEKHEALEQPMKPSLTCFSTKNGLPKSESEVPKTLQSAKCSVPKVEKDVTIPSGCEEALVQASGMPDTQDLLSTNSHVNQYEPCIRHEDEKSEASERPMKPSITGFSTEKAIESEPEVPRMLLPANRALPKVEKDVTNLSVSDSESRPPTHAAQATETVTTASVLDYREILNSIAPHLCDVDMVTLLPYLQQHHLVTLDEEHHLTSDRYSSIVKSQKLLNYLKHKGRESLQKFLCSLNLAHDHTGHKGIADKLKKAMQTNGIDCDDFCSDYCKKS